MTENNEVAEPIDGAIKGGIGILPKTDKRPMAIVGMGSSGKEQEQVKQLSERLNGLGMEHVLMTVKDAEKEGITREDLVSAQLGQAQSEGLLAPNPIFNPSKRKGGGSKAQQKFKRKKKGKKTHRKKRK